MHDSGDAGDSGDARGQVLGRTLQPPGHVPAVCGHVCDPVRVGHHPRGQVPAVGSHTRGFFPFEVLQCWESCCWFTIVLPSQLLL